MTIEQSQLSDISSDTFSQLSVEAEASYGGLVKVSGGHSQDEGRNFLAVEGSELKISFKVRKVAIQRPWMDPAILHYPIVGIKGLEDGAWSSGRLDVNSNEGLFPLLPTAMVVAKDVVISSNSFSDTLKQAFINKSAHASIKVCF